MEILNIRPINPQPFHLAMGRVVPEQFFIYKNGETTFLNELWKEVVDWSIPDATQSMEERGAVGEARYIDVSILEMLKKKYI